MTSSTDLGAVAWRKSTYSNGDGGNCVEVADGLPGVVPVRDSKYRSRAALLIPSAGWSAFIGHLKNT